MVNDKRSHANLLHDRWNRRWKKDIISHRLRISYKETYLARTKGSVLHHKNLHMYRKRLDTFSVTRSKKVKTAKAQEKRHQRACRRIFHAKEHNRMDTTRHRLTTAQRYRFLFLPSQYIYKPIKHLQYTHGLDYPDYGFKIPYINRTDERDTLVHTVEQYNPIPNMFIPLKYRDIIPKEPLYTPLGVYIIPGSREWFTYMYNLDLGRRNLPSAPRLSRAERRVLKNNQRIKAVAEGSLLHGTSVKHYEQRVEAKKWLTLVLDYHHNKMTHLTARYDDSNDTEHKRKLHQEMVVFNAQFCKDVSICATVPKSDDELYTYSNKGKAWICNPLQPHFKVDTSDDTTKIERRPNKRLTTSQFNPLPVGDHDDRLKRR
ncbi:hypothetical protein RhiirA4_486149 [Rhizophagus irregularis]|uniref:DUF8211 domain-containing protein n=1 Tax=Rhizophagus irregularis TaxID=588596 RepID=A0A2I1HR11_9GLOM|nr:hypothetical protein RhiirA4_486149 [Rhizophagus irregularis]